MSKLYIDFNDKTYCIFVNKSRLIVIYDYSNVFGFNINIPRQFNDRLLCYSEENFEQFFTTRLPDIINFVHSIQEDDDIFSNPLHDKNCKIYENDERIVRFFEEILSSPLCKTKSARR